MMPSQFMPPPLSSRSLRFCHALHSSLVTHPDIFSYICTMSSSDSTRSYPTNALKLLTISFKTPLHHRQCRTPTRRHPPSPQYPNVSESYSMATSLPIGPGMDLHENPTNHRNAFLTYTRPIPLRLHTHAHITILLSITNVSG